MIRSSLPVSRVTDLESGRAALRDRLGAVGLWTFQLDGLNAADERILVQEIERAGFSALWLAEGTASKEALSHSSVLLAATEEMVVATGIANVWARDSVAAASAGRYLTDAFDGRFVLGLGVSHPGALQRRGHSYSRPLAVMRDYLQQMNDAKLSSPGSALAPPRVIAALRPRMLELAAEMTHGAHTYFVPPCHTANARSILGQGPVLIPEQAVVLETDAAIARGIAREYTARYLAREHYSDNLRALGFTESDLTGTGSDLLVDSLVAWGGVERIAKRLAEHREAGADHVAVQILTAQSRLTSEDVFALGHMLTD